MRYRVLGTTRALRDDGTPAAVGGARLRALLTVLALRAGRAVPVGVLVAEVWADEPPVDAVGALQALVGRLRRALGPGVVVSADGGYRLCADEDEVDLHRFGRLAGEGARALEEGDPAKAAALLDEALGLWAGPALADLPDRGAEAARWETRRGEARRSLLTAALALGRADEALPELVALCDEFPLDERLHALRIRALRDAARPAEALAAYEEVRRSLADRLGTGPGPELRALHADLLHGGDRGNGPGGRPGRSAWAGGPPPYGAPDPDGVVRADGAPDSKGAGRTHGVLDSGGAVSRGGALNAGGVVPRGGAPDSDGAVPPDGTGVGGPGPGAVPPPGNLRARLTSFVGREADIDAIRDDLGRSRLVTLLGPGGAGKTRLSQEAAERVADGWPDGVWLAELAPVEDPATVPEAVLAALGARQTVLRGAGAGELRAVDPHAAEPLARLVEHCARRRMILLLDNCEHVVQGAADLVQELLTHCPGLTVLATSREPLGVPGETVRPVEPLPPDPAHRLFGERGRAVRPGFEPAADPGAVEEICRRLDGLPLAIELAAARLRLLTPRQIADRLDDRFRLLTSGSRTVLPRQQTLRAVVDWSWDLLDARERAVLRRLSVVAGGCDLTAAENICADSWPSPAGDSRAGTSAGPGPGAREEERPPYENRAAAVGAGEVGEVSEVSEVGDAGEVVGVGSSVDPTYPVSAPDTLGTAGSGAADPVDYRDVAALLGSLIDKSLVVATPSAGGEMRYRLLETVAEYAAERLDESGERAAAAHRHLVHYRELARTTDPLLRGRGQRAALTRLQLEYENLRTALRRAVAAHNEQEGLCLVLSLGWFWQMLDLRADARQWALAVSALGPDPFTSPAEPAPPIEARCTDAPPPLAPDVLQEARRQVRLIEVATMNHQEDGWTTPARRAWLRTVVQVYRPGLPQTCRFPGSLWLYAVMLTGDDELLRHVMDETVRACAELGYEWELAGALQARANVLANRRMWAGDAGRDADRSLEIYERLGDAWGAAEALSARGEARERGGDHALAAEDYAAAIGHADGLGARSQVILLRTRVAGTLFERGRGEEGERLIRELLEEGGDEAHQSLLVARLFLTVWLGCTGRVAEARQHMRTLLEVFRGETLALFVGMMKGHVAWLDCEEGQYATALAGVREALVQARAPLSRLIAPELAVGQLMTAAWALGGLAADRPAPGLREDRDGLREDRDADGGPDADGRRDPARGRDADRAHDAAPARNAAPARDADRAWDAARLIGAHEALLPTGHVRTYMERHVRERAVATVRAVLSDEAFETARAEGGGLTLEEAAALLGPADPDHAGLRTSCGTCPPPAAPSPA
ncbi:AfsR/SARP family transcriptional regulator [Streptomyces sp. NPDC001780]